MDVATITKQLGALPAHKQKEVLILLNELSDAKTRSAAQGDFLDFVREVWPAFIEGSHHKIMADREYAPTAYQIGIRISFVSGMVSG